MGVSALTLAAGCSEPAETTAETAQVRPQAIGNFASEMHVTLPISVVRLPGQGEDAGKTVVYRDTWGVAHIYAPTPEKGMYAMGWAQAEDRPDQLLKSILIALGEIASIAGPDQVQTDLRSRMFDHYGVAKAGFDTIPAEVQTNIRAFARGMNDYFAAHAADKPAWWGNRKVDEYMIVAFGRLFLYNWSIDEAFGDLERGGIAPGYEPAQRGSNQWSVSPQRSAVKAPILYIDPHLDWFGPSRFWEVRIHAGDLEGSGVTLPGSPYIGLGHNANVAWAMTTGGPDTADIYALTLKEGDPTQYLHDGKYRLLEKREVTIAVRGGDPQKHTIWQSHLGPIVALHGNKAYAAAMAYADSVGTSTAWHYFNFARDYRDFQKGLDTLDVFPQNVMTADTAGNIYYQRAGRVPIRPAGYDWSLPVDGTNSASAWKGIHSTADLLQVLNPPQGYMQNCNIPPDAMIPNSPFALAKTAPYVYASLDHGPKRDGWTNQRGARAIQLLGADDSVTIDEALTYAVDTKVYGVERWLAALKKANEKFGSDHAANENFAKGLADVLAWDGRLDAASTGALKYYYWRRQLVADYGEAAIAIVANRVDQWYKIVSGEAETDPELSDQELQSAAESFAKAMDRLVKEMGALDKLYGDKFRVGRDDASWPVSGGGDYGARTLRSMGYDKERDDFTQWGKDGQTSTQIVVLTKPVQSWWYLPIGESDKKGSPHYRDLAEKAYSPAKLQPTWWLPKDLANHIESRTVLDKA
jgi:acyl-homoserine lactone acylase PvdQ